MSFLVDAQWPPALARFLEAEGHEAAHVFDLDMAKSCDRDIWRYAGDKGAVIISKDEDFVTLSTLEPDGPPLVWIRIGNTTKRELLARLNPHLRNIIEALENGEKLVEVG